MDTKTFAKLVAFIILGCIIEISGLVIPCFFTESIWGPLIGFLIGWCIIIVLFATFVPWWFKDYIEEFWKMHPTN